MLAYLIAAGCCVLAARRAPPRDRALWLTLAGALALLACNKQLDLQSFFTQMMRDFAQRGGWYAHRRQAQLAFLAGLTLAGTAVLAWLAVRMRASAAGIRLAVIGIGCLFLFVLGRAASFHHVDAALGWPAGPTRLSSVPEIVGSLLVGLGALHAAWDQRSR